ncbi:MAG TPA: polyribonucleotide nucleotidyltransferase [Myxococcota bacterium]|nr:polyribonucleotide nucleotidyltransferase [Myxococcota bacterium]
MNTTKNSIRLGDKDMVIETGKIAKQADGACLISYGETVVLITAVSDKKPKNLPFLPLTVDYREKTYAAGRIPGGFFKREGRPSETDILTCRIIDRSIRPLFPKGYNYETQVIGLPLSADPLNAPDVLTATGASVALSISDIPFDGPLATVRVGRVDGQLVINPTFKQLETSDMDIVVTASAEAITMVEGDASEISESDLVAALMFAKDECQPIIALQQKLMTEVGKTKRVFTPHVVDEEIRAEVKKIASEPLAQALSEKEKLPRYAALRVVKDDILTRMAEKHPDQDNLERDVSETIDEIKKTIVRGNVTREGRRLDGRGLTEVRPISIEVGFLPRAHGSALFTRGETQSIVTTTLGTSRDEQLIENLQGDYRRQFMLHYNFPPFSTAEVKFLRGPGRREIGHGKLAERALSKVLPKHDDFSYTIRIASEITESNGSSSMATVCGGSLSMMDAGVNTSAPIAGVAMGMMKEGGEFHVLTDILGDEDHLGDMDFKVAGSSAGITAVQMDIKISGVTSEVLERALAQARDGRLHILGEMNKVISEPRSDLSPYAPRIITIKVKPERIKDVIGPGGRVVKEIIAQTGCSIDIEDDGSIHIGSTNPDSAQQAIDMVKELTQEAEVGKLYMGTVRKITDFGAFCEIIPGTDGLLHISELSDKRVEKVTDVLREGDEVLVKVVGIDRQGKIRLSRKEAMGQQLEEK